MLRDKRNCLDKSVDRPFIAPWLSRGHLTSKSLLMLAVHADCHAGQLVTPNSHHRQSHELKWGKTHTHNKKQPCQSMWGFRNKQGKFLKKWIQMYPKNIPDLFAHLYFKRKLFCLVFVICSIALFWNICLKNFYTSWNDDYNKFSEHLSHTDRKLRKWKKNCFPCDENS